MCAFDYLCGALTEGSIVIWGGGGYQKKSCLSVEVQRVLAADEQGC